jgi:hypothetical protein
VFTNVHDLCRYRFWPAQIVTIEDCPPVLQKREHKDGEFPVRFFGTNEYAGPPLFVNSMPALTLEMHPLLFLSSIAFVNIERLHASLCGDASSNLHVIFTLTSVFTNTLRPR